VVVLSFLTPDAEKGLINRDLALGRTPHVPSQPSVSFVTFRSNRLSWAFFCKTGTENDSSFVSLTPDAEKVLINRDLALPHAPRPLPTLCTLDAEKRLANRDLALAHAPRSLPTLCILRYLLFKLIVFAFFCKDRDWKLETAILSFLAPDAEKRLANRDLALPRAPRSLPPFVSFVTFCSN
jgi:hypothetical protein